MQTRDSGASRGSVLLGIVAATLTLTVIGTLSPLPADAGTRGTAKEIFTAARARLIQKTQLAGSWTASPYGTGSTGGGPDASGTSGKPIDISQCGNVNEVGVDQNPYYVEGDYFDQKGTSAELQEELDVFPNAKQATEDVRFTATAPFRNCFVTVFSQRKGSIASGVGKGASVGAITAQPLTIGRYGEGSAGFQLQIPITYQGITTDLYYNYIALAVGKYEADLDESDLGTPLPAKIGRDFELAVVKSIKNG